MGSATRWLLLALLCAGCPSGGLGDDSCEDGDARCAGSQIQYCDIDTWAEPESCPDRQMSSGLTVTQICHSDSSGCAP